MKYFCLLILTGLFLVPVSVSAATTKFEVTGWIPYWRAEKGVADVMPHLDDITEINPFVYTLKKDGTIVDNGKIDQEPWLTLFAAARAKKVRIIPTIMSGDGATLHALLSNSSSRIALEDSLAALVKNNGFDGIDIDFEAKKAETRPYFSTFLKGLYQRMGKKWVMCTIESRTPIDSRYYGTDIPADATIYANDFKMINKYCDRVRIMAYDQQGIDQQLAHQAETSSEVYAPIADPRWVRKTIEVASKDINKNKLLIGVPTYGYEYDVMAYAGSQYVYNLLWSFNPGYVKEIATKYGLTAQRNSAGEMFMTYTPIPNASTTEQVIPVPNSAMVAAAAAAMYANTVNGHQSFRLIDWPDAQSIAGKVELAQTLGVRGVSIFKFDGGEDPGIWSVIEGMTQSDMMPEPGYVAPRIAPDSISLSLKPLTRALGIGASGTDVRTLQVVLNSNKDTAVATSGTGSKGHESTTFGPATEKAVQKFQIKYGIAKVSGSGYGFVGPATRAKLNTLLANL
ncbi:MAG: Sporulation-specific glycosylase YdhD [Candidatus Kaiserbacteria bacterium GW2011_GWC2_52_8b]|uniref:Sporulation-specific glycosylase YdhD n=2 Tax=Candidatus Kaiseribacteriota TaxID=1752734 RepID=A0A0G1ZU23_9BACT|nr:MAG: Sporulation-specific glycosylase YdhD [Candidatus Kaiserbacteria bacterium GW2011_GWA2_52_12]KKW31812.1 MAG: Sporulation-specific glycosylase YdhD [Candidatus Kaiserbacteria bacterium GW2011_GWC2_52_8b]